MNIFKAWLSSPDTLILDTETTGLSKDDQVLSIAVLNTHGEVLFEKLLQPTVRIDKKASRVHGLTLEDLQHQPLYPEVHAELHGLLFGKTVLAFNSAFDQRMLQQTAAAFGLPEVPARWACVMEAFRGHLGEGRIKHPLETAVLYKKGSGWKAHGLQPWDARTQPPVRAGS